MKPPYRVPSMAEIRALEPNGYRVASLFAGTGGSSLGYRMAGFSVVYANEFIPAARECYALNASPKTVIDGRDVRTVRPEDIIEKTGLAVGDLDILDGSPPCASFSTAGKRSEGWGKVKKYSDTKQRTDDLFFEYVRILKGLRPRVFVAENVSGLVKGVAKGYFREILAELKTAGYRVSARLLDAQWLGVPQARQRLIFVGIRDDLGIDPVHPGPLPYRYSVRDAIPWISRVRQRNVFNEPDRVADDGPAAPTATTCGLGAKSAALVSVEIDADISRFAIGAEWDKISPGQQSERFFNLVKPDLVRPCPTITAEGGNASLASVVHPTERRKFAIAELKRICAFPDDFALTGTYAQQWERLGRAVPPLMMRAVAETIRDKILDRA